MVGEGCGGGGTLGVSGVRFHSWGLAGSVRRERAMGTRSATMSAFVRSVPKGRANDGCAASKETSILASA